MSAHEDTVLDPERFADLAARWTGTRGPLSPLAPPDPTRTASLGDVPPTVRAAMEVLASPMAALEIACVGEAGVRTSVIHWTSSGAEAAVAVDDGDRTSLCTPASVRAALADHLGAPGPDADAFVVTISAPAALVLAVLLDLQRQAAILAAAGKAPPHTGQRRACDPDELVRLVGLLGAADHHARAASALADEPAWAVTWLTCTLLAPVMLDRSQVVAAVDELIERGAAEPRDGDVVLTEQLASLGSRLLVVRRLVFLTSKHVATEGIDEDELICGLDGDAACWVLLDPDASGTVRFGCGSTTAVASLAARAAGRPSLLRDLLPGGGVAS